MSSTDRRTVRDLRAVRRRRRLGETEWFDVAYRVYLWALVAFVATILISDAVSGVIADDVTVDDVVAVGPATLGLVMVAAVAVGLRNGAQGGPLAIEAADVRHLLTAPVSRRMVLQRPIGQRMRSVAFGLAVGAAVLAQLVARELDESRGAWAVAAAVYGVLVGLGYVAAAVLAHAARVPPWLATAVGAAALVWQGAATWTAWRDDREPVAGPADGAGGVAFWAVRIEPADVVAVAVVVAATVAALAVGGRLRIEPLVGRADLVSQLKFAATVQDLRTVVLLRRQLRAEHLRPRPWGAPSPRAVPTAARPAAARPTRTVAAGHPARLVHRRGVASLRRLPAARLARIAVLGALAGLLASLTVSQSPLFALGLVGATFLVGLECVEPLSQEIDRPDLTDGVPVERGWIYAHHLVAPSALVALAGLVGAAVATLAEPDHAVAAFALAVPVAWAGSIGAVVATVRDAPQPAEVADTSLTGRPRRTDSPLVPPEFAGAQNAYRTFLPVVVSGLAALPVLAMRVDPSAGTVARSAIGVGLVVLALVVWVRRRDRWSMALRRFLAEGREQARVVT